MSFTTTPKAGAHVAPIPTAQGPSARDRAIAMVQGANTQQSSPVKNPSQVAPEEMSVVSPSSKGQQHNSEAPQSPPESVQEASKPTPTQSEEIPLSNQYAILARKEKAIRMKAQEQKAKEDAFKAREAELEKSYLAREAQAKKAWEAKLLEDPISVMNETGLSYEQLVNQVLNQPKPEEVAYKQAYKKLEAEIQELKDGRQQDKKSLEEQQTQQYTQAVNQIRSEVKQLVTSDPAFETIKETNSVKDVVELIERTFKEDGILLSVEDAAKAVEDHLVEEYMKITRIKKIQQRLQPKESAPKQSDVAPQQQDKQPQQMKTLTNAVGVSRQLSAKERAILAFKGELKN